MIAFACPNAAELLVELERLGVTVGVKGDKISLRPASTVPADLMMAIRDQKPAMIDLLADPRFRWRSQAEALLAGIAEAEQRDGLLETFDERRAIAAIEGGLNENQAGCLAYIDLRNRIALVTPTDPDSMPPDVHPVERPGVRGE